MGRASDEEGAGRRGERKEAELILCGWHICRAEFARITKTSVAGKRTRPTQSGLIWPEIRMRVALHFIKAKAPANEPWEKESRGRGRVATRLDTEGACPRWSNYLALMKFTGHPR